MKVQYQFENISSSKLCQLFVQCCQTSARWEGGGSLESRQRFARIFVFGSKNCQKLCNMRTETERVNPCIKVALSGLK